MVIGSGTDKEKHDPGSQKRRQDHTRGAGIPTEKVIKRYFRGDRFERHLEGQMLSIQLVDMCGKLYYGKCGEEKTGAA